MCELVAMSTQQPTNLTLSLSALAEHSSDGGPADGWGVAYYNHTDVRVIRDTTAAHDSPWADFVAQHGLTSRTVIAHIRKATHGAVELENTQPFVRELGGRAHVFAHNGHFPQVLDAARYRSHNYQRLGSSDSEQAFCHLLERLRSLWLDNAEPPSFERRWRLFQQYCADLRPLGPANILYSDSEYLFVHGNRRTQADGERRPPGLYWLCRECGCDSALSSRALSINTEKQTVVLVASVPLTDEPWQALAEGELLAAREGRILARALPNEGASVCQSR